MTNNQFVPYQVGDKVEIFRNVNNVAVNGGYAGFQPVQGVVTAVGPNNTHFVVSASYGREYVLDANSRFDNAMGLHHSRKVS